MNAMIFAAGMGTRLKPFTSTHPKALVSVDGIPMLQRVITKIKRYGVKRIVINTHHFATQIRAFLDANNNFGADIVISDEPTLLDTGGGILAAKKHLDDDVFLVHNCDILTDAPLNEMFDGHRSTGADATLLTRTRPSSRHLFFGTDDHRLKGWADTRNGQVRPEKFNPNDKGLIEQSFGGVHILSPTIFPLLEKYAQSHGSVFSITPFYTDVCQNAKIEMFASEHDYYWFDIGSIDNLQAAEQFIKLKHVQ